MDQQDTNDYKVLPSYLLTYDSIETQKLPKKISEEHQLVAFTNKDYPQFGEHKQVLSRADIFNAMTQHDNNHNLFTFGISNEELEKAYEDTAHRFEVA